VKNATRRGKKFNLLTPGTFSLIHATDFADRYERQISPLLSAGYIVLCDRYIFTAFARDGTRGCDPKWVRNIYSFAPLPDITFFFKVRPEVAIERILENRPKLQHYEAGMDMNLSPDPYESFRIFQGRINDHYVRMVPEYKFVVMDANKPIEKQQELMRSIIAKKIDLPGFRWKTPPVQLPVIQSA
jgi:dTMP kinase